ncbi:syntaxin-23-like [Impatiens glandulifera]|uniref:syntaxin-23-like n=1 Tax=Impatiens glandulifera TaxID=253017 RepID=UPI001FB173F0|nr:syntaxin-23-like [Impatiens glandulifera]
MSFQDLKAGRPINSKRGLLNSNQDPTQVVASGIFQINTAVSTFHRLELELITAMTISDGRQTEDKTTHYTIKLANDFQLVLQEFQKAQRLAAEKETAITFTQLDDRRARFLTIDDYVRWFFLFCDATISMQISHLFQVS